VSHVLIAAILAVVVTAMTGAFLWWSLGRPSMPTGTKLLPRDVLDLSRLSLTTTAGIGGIVALVVAYRRQRVHELQSRREYTKLCNERFGRAADEIGSDRAAVRLAGVHALAGLADDWPAGRQTCVDVLCAYLRMPYTGATPQNADVETGNKAEDHAELRRVGEERQIRQTVLGLIGVHLRVEAVVSWTGLDFDFTGSVFDGGDLGGSWFTGGRVSFQDVTFLGPRFSFQDGMFSGGTVLFDGAHFASGGIYFGGARFCGADVYFSGANFDGSAVSFVGASFTGGHLHLNAAFRTGSVTFDLAEFRGTQVTFEGARFSGATVDLSTPRAYDVPPRLDRWERGVPAGLLLPGNRNRE
jgi:uncharacterized protein YjbI with pentapeptide repeats